MKNTKQLNKKNVARLSVKIKPDNFDQLTSIEKEMIKNKYYVKLSNKLNKLQGVLGCNTLPEMDKEPISRKDFARFNTRVIKFKESQNKQIKLIDKLTKMIPKHLINQYQETNFFKSAILAMR